VHFVRSFYFPGFGHPRKYLLNSEDKYHTIVLGYVTSDA